MDSVEWMVDQSVHSSTEFTFYVVCYWRCRKRCYDNTNDDIWQEFRQIRSRITQITACGRKQ